MHIHIFVFQISDTLDTVTKTILDIVVVWYLVNTRFCLPLFGIIRLIYILWFVAILCAALGWITSTWRIKVISEQHRYRPQLVDLLRTHTYNRDVC